MKLYDVPKGSKIRLKADCEHPPAHRAFESGEVLTFKHIDGMYSLCIDKDGEYVHLVAWAEVEVIPDVHE